MTYDEDNVPQQPIRVWLYGDGFCSIDGELAEQRRPRGRGGYCLCKSYLTAVKEGK